MNKSRFLCFLMFKRQFWQLWCLQNLPNLATDNVLPILATDDTCQFLQLLCLQNFPILATYNICQFWQLMILANFG